VVTAAFEIVDLEEYTESVNMLVYGDSGSGKTVLAGTAPRALFLATEKGVIAAKRQGSTAKLHLCQSWQDIENAYVFLRDNPDDFDWVIIDSLTEFQQHLLRMILDRNVEENPNRDPDIPAIQDHQKWQNMYKRYVRQFNDLPVNMLYTATAFRKSDEEGEDLILPDILGKDYGMSQWTCAAMHVVGYLSKRKVKRGEEKIEVRRLLCERTGPYFGKDRYDVLVPYVQEPTMPEIIRRIGQPPKSAAKKATTTVRRPARKAPAKKAAARRAS
jgi:hypothetical protein